MNYKQQLQRYFHEYEKDHPGKTPTTTDVAAWMIKTKRWEPKSSDLISRCSEDISTALREEYRTDPMGRRYRVNHAVRSQQGTFWAAMEVATRSHMEKAFSQRRKQIVGDCVQLKTDVDVYNDKNTEERPIQVVFDFTDDVKEAQASGAHADVA